MLWLQVDLWTRVRCPWGPSLEVWLPNLLLVFSSNLLLLMSNLSHRGPAPNSSAHRVSNMEWVAVTYRYFISNSLSICERVRDVTPLQSVHIGCEDHPTQSVPGMFPVGAWISLSTSIQWRGPPVLLTFLLSWRFRLCIDIYGAHLRRLPKCNRKLK
jgi:hypothetical protein